MAEKRIDELDALTAENIVHPEQNYIILEAPYADGLKKIPISDIVEIVRRLDRSGNA